MKKIDREQGGIALIDSVEHAFTGLNEEHLQDPIPSEDIDEVLRRLETPIIGADELLTEEVSSSAVTTEEDDEAFTEDVELDLSAGELDKTSDPIRVYMREMGLVPLLKREQEVAIAKRIEWGHKRAQNAISRSPIAVAELLKIGEEIQAGTLGIRDVVAFSDQTETEEQDDKAEEYLQWTIEGIQNVRKLYRRGLKEFEQLRAAQKLARAKGSKKALRLKRKLARTRLEIAHEISTLRLKEAARQRLVNAIGRAYKETRLLERQIEDYTEKLGRKRVSADDKKEFTRHISAAKRRLKELEAEHHVSALEIKRSHQVIAVGEAQAAQAKHELTEANLRLVV